MLTQGLAAEVDACIAQFAGERDEHGRRQCLNATRTQSCHPREQRGTVSSFRPSLSRTMTFEAQLAPKIYLLMFFLVSHKTYGMSLFCMRTR